MALFTQLIIGTVIGSFLFATFSRIQIGQTCLTPARSYCDHCQHQLGWGELIPIISYLYLRGRCRYCRTVITPWTLIVEGYFGLLAIAWQPTLTATCMTLIGGLLCFMSLHDLATMRVPSLYFYLIMLCASVTHLSNLTWWHVGLIACWLLFQLLPDTNRYFGAGDVDLCLSFAILFDLYHLAWLLLIASCTALLVAIVSGRRQLPFIPFLTAGYLTLVFVNLVRF